MGQGDALQAQAGAGEAEQPPLLEMALAVTDHAGCERQGRAVLLPRWPAGASGGAVSEDEDFRIVILSEPPQDPISPGEGVVVSVPARRLGSGAGSVREAVATYGAAEQHDLALPPHDMELLRQGRLFAATPLQVSAEDVFAGGEARLALLARELLVSRAMSEYLSPIAIALNAPDDPRPASQERLQELKELIRAVSENEFGGEAGEMELALAHLSELVFAADAEHFLACAQCVYPNRRTLMEDIYMLRAFQQRPQQASELLSMRRFLREAAVPAEEADLALDRSLAMEQLTFVTLAVEPHRMSAAGAMVASFHRRYVSVYREHHTRYWCEMARLHARLREEQGSVEALRQLNTLSELGPPAGAGALAAYEELVAETAGCPLIGGVEEMLETEAMCPACGLSLEQWPPAQRIDEILKRIERACDRQITRLSSSAVQQVLRRNGDARVDQFLKMIQASQLSSLRDVIDDELVGYVRRFLVESRIEEALHPILDQLQEGVTPKVDEAQTAMREVSGVLQRAFQATQIALPPGEKAAKESQPRHKRKR